MSAVLANGLGLRSAVFNEAIGLDEIPAVDVARTLGQH